MPCQPATELRAVMQQLTLPFTHRPALEREDFLVTSHNAEAVAWIDRWPEWPSHVVVLHGLPGCGKTHLAHVFAAKAEASILSGKAGLVLDPPALVAEASALVIDNADAGLDPVSFFHLFNLAREHKCSLLLTAATPPSGWGIKLPDLRSRLNTAPTARISDPDDAVMAAVLIKMFADRQIKVGTDVLEYALKHMERSFDAARSLVGQADMLSLSEGRPVTAHFVRRLLKKPVSGSGETCSSDAHDIEACSS